MLQNSKREMEYRNVINRAYYGAFLTARDAASVANKSGGVHQSVSKCYLKDKSTVSNDLDSLKKLRQEADYEPTKDLKIEAAKESCRIAKRILEALES